MKKLNLLNGLFQYDIAKEINLLKNIALYNIMWSSVHYMEFDYQLHQKKKNNPTLFYLTSISILDPKTGLLLAHNILRNKLTK